MKYAFWPGCVALGGTPELYTSTKLVLAKLGIEVVELVNASCTGAGVLQEKNRKLGDTLNVRTFAQAQDMGLNIMTICSTMPDSSSSGCSATPTILASTPKRSAFQETTLATSRRASHTSRSYRPPSISTAHWASGGFSGPTSGAQLRP